MTGATLQLLKRTLADIVIADTDYAARAGLVMQAMYLAHLCGFETGIRLDPQEPEWPTVLIELPTGQVSWHMPAHLRAWDGHTTEQKFARIQRFVSEDEVVEVKK